MPDRAIDISQAPSQAMICVRADLSTLGVRVADALGVAMPSARGITASGDRHLAWMAPDELLILGPSSSLAEMSEAIDAALAGHHHLVQDVSDMLVRFRVAGSGCREVLAKLVPADLHPETFREGELRRTRLAQIPCAFWLEGEAIHLICFRSVARYAQDLLTQAASEGSEVDFFPAS